VWMLFLPRRWRIVCFFIVTPWQLGIILTANYTFLNYLVLMLGFLLLDDRFLAQFLPKRRKERLIGGRKSEAAVAGAAPLESQSILQTAGTSTASPSLDKADDKREWRARLQSQFEILKIALTALIFAWLFYASTVQMIWMIFRGFPLPTTPVVALEPFRIADRYGLFAVMTRGRYEIEFQGSADGQNWVPYPFRFKPQDPSKAPGIYAPYQPRFDWNLWFASLGDWRSDPIVTRTEERLLAGDKDVLSLFAANPFRHELPRQVRAVLWQYWFTTPEEKRAQGTWWRRQVMGMYAPTLEREADGKIAVIEWPTELTPRQ
jgi:lipase maturation factor 1